MKRWLIFTGQARDKANFLVELDKAQQLRKEGLLDGLKWVTWPDEEKNLATDLRQTLDRAGVEVVTAYQAKTGQLLGSGLWQLNQLATGLCDLDPDDFVLKSRPDVILPLSRSRDLLNAAPHPVVESWARQAWGLERKIATNWFHPAKLFTFCDVVYAGHVSDLNRLNDISAAIDFGIMTRGAFPHLGTLGFNFNSLNNPVWGKWLEAFYPGTHFPKRTENWLQHSSRFLAGQIAFDWSDHYMGLITTACGRYDSFLYGFATFYACADEVFLFPERNAERVGLAGREYWAHFSDFADYSGHWPFSGLGDKKTIHQLFYAPTTDPLLQRLRLLDPRKNPQPFGDMEAARLALAKASPEFVRQNFYIWTRMLLGRWREKMFG